MHQMCNVSRNFSVLLCSEKSRVELNFFCLFWTETQGTFLKNPLRFLIFMSFYINTTTKYNNKNNFKLKKTPWEINLVVESNIINMEGGKPLFCKLQLSFLVNLFSFTYSFRTFSHTFSFIRTSFIRTLRLRFDRKNLRIF